MALCVCVERLCFKATRLRSVFDDIGPDQLGIPRGVQVGCRDIESAGESG